MEEDDPMTAHFAPPVSEDRRARAMADAVAGADRPRSTARIRAQLLFMLVLSDLAVIAGAFLLSQVARSGGAMRAPLLMLVTLLPLYGGTAVLLRAWREEVLLHALRSIGRATAATMCALFLLTGLALAMRPVAAEVRLESILYILVGTVAMALSRGVMIVVARRLLPDGLKSTLLVFDGAHAPIEKGWRAVDSSALGVVVPDLNDHDMLDRLGTALIGFDHVAVATVPGRRTFWSVVLRAHGIEGEILLPELEQTDVLAYARLGQCPTAIVSRGALMPVERALKRLFDLAVVIAAAPILLPVGIICAVAIKLDSPGPVFFTQPRIGRGNRKFPIYKFRTMRTDRCDADAAQLTLRNDPRVTRVGDFLRRTSLDEIPQLLNVLQGHMSIVGPRPHAHGARAGDLLYWEVAPHYWARHAVKPGLTGLAQVRGFRGTTHDPQDLLNRLGADLEYVNRWSLLGDVLIVIGTLRVLVGSNTY